MNQEINDSNQADPPKRVLRKCPSCSEPIVKLQLSAFAMPVEQFTVPWLRMINQNVGWSLRTFGQSQMDELQFLAFTCNCRHCGHISWWDIPTDEFEEILSQPDHSLRLGWASSADSLNLVIERLPKEYRSHFEKLLTAITPEDAKK